MLLAIFRNLCFAGAAYQQAGLCETAARHGFVLGLLMLFVCFLTNTLIAAWLRGHP